MFNDAFEKRQFHRYFLSWPVEINGSIGLIRDISVGGVSLEIKHVHIPENLVRFVIFPLFVKDAPNSINCIGKIMRFMENENNVVLAINLVEFYFDYNSQRFDISQILSLKINYPV